MTCFQIQVAPLGTGSDIKMVSLISEPPFCFRFFLLVSTSLISTDTYDLTLFYFTFCRNRLINPQAFPRTRGKTVLIRPLNC